MVEEEERRSKLKEVAEKRSAKEKEKKLKIVPKKKEPEISPEEKIKPLPVSQSVPIVEEEKVKLKPIKEKTESHHKYLQTLIKKMGEEKGYRAILEQATPDDQGRVEVDVCLEKNGKKSPVRSPSPPPRITNWAISKSV
ncbi:MAG: hypothetical protein HY787_03575 [Deltaproteobacteria bacterium]|nr:hypothetical protein [Deltaproteobacteria bacterium]